MPSRKCTNEVKVNFYDKKICGAEQFYKQDEQCPKLCAHCGGILNPDYVEGDEANINVKTKLRTDGPTLLEWVNAGYSIEDYPPPDYEAKPYTDDEEKEAIELELSIEEQKKSQKAAPSKVETPKVETPKVAPKKN